MEDQQAQGDFIPGAVEYVIGLILELHSFPPRIFLFVSVILTNRGLFSKAKRRAPDGVSRRIE